MIPIILNTAGGNHPPASYAAVCARTIFSIDPSITTDRASVALNLQGGFISVLTKHFASLISREVESLATFVDHCDTAITYVAPIAEQIVQELQALAAGTPWGAKLAEAEWAIAALNTIASHLATAIHVERLLFGDANPTNPSAVAYKARTTGA